MYQMTVRTPGLTWVRVASSLAEALAILQAGSRPGCTVEVCDTHGAPVTLAVVADADAALEDELPLAA